MLIRPLNSGDEPASLLVVDDEAAVRRMLCRTLESDGHRCSPASSVEEARQLLAAHSFELAVCDVQLPGESGLDLVRDIAGNHPDTGILMVSGQNNPAVAAQAAELGAYGYLVKPFSREQLLISTGNALRRRALEIFNRDYQELLEETVAQRTQELREANEELHTSRLETIHRLSMALDMRDSETGAHVARIGELSETLAAKLGVEEELGAPIALAARMHDVGKIGIPDAILRKPGPLTPEERRIMQTHTEIGYRILENSGSTLLDLAAEIALTHHERYDGSGYPGGLRGEEIPLAGRIVAVADVFDALLSDRPYRPARSLDEAQEAIRAGRGSHFDPDIVDCFFGNVEEIAGLVAAGG